MSVTNSPQVKRSVSTSSINSAHSSATEMSADALSATTEKSRDLLGFDPNDPKALEKAIFSCINDGDRDSLLNIFENHPSPTNILQLLLTVTYPNRDGFYKHEQDVLKDAEELLGPSLEHLNCIQIACILGDEELALDILDFVTKTTEEIDARKVLYEFMGRVWGNGNTTLHLASFLGMSDLVKKMIELGATTSRLNERHYKAVDCADDDITVNIFKTVEESEGYLTNTASIAKRIEVPVQSKPQIIAAENNPRTLRQGHQRSQSLESKATPPVIQEDLSRLKKARAATVSATSPGGSPTQSAMCSADSRVPKKLKPKKSVSFDQTVMIFQVCQFQDALEITRDQMRDIILNSKLDVNNLFTPHQYLTPLHVACTHGSTFIANLLLTEAGSLVNTRDVEGWTPMHCAAAEGHLEILKLLGRCQGVNGTASPNAKTDWIYTPDGPIDLAPENEDGDLPEDIALEQNQAEIQAWFDGIRRIYPPPTKSQAHDQSESVEGQEVEDDDEEQELEETQEPKRQQRQSSKGLSLELNRTFSVMHKRSKEVPEHTKPMPTPEQKEKVMNDGIDHVAPAPVPASQPNEAPTPTSHDKVKIDEPAVQHSEPKTENTITLPKQDMKQDPQPVESKIQPADAEQKADQPAASRAKPFVFTALNDPLPEPSILLSPTQTTRNTLRKTSISRPRNSVLVAAMGETSSGDFSWMKEDEMKRHNATPSKRQSKIIDRQHAGLNALERAFGPAKAVSESHAQSQTQNQNQNGSRQTNPNEGELDVGQLQDATDNASAELKRFKSVKDRIKTFEATVTNPAPFPRKPKSRPTQ